MSLIPLSPRLKYTLLGLSIVLFTGIIVYSYKSTEKSSQTPHNTPHMTTLPPTHITTLPPTHMTTLPPPHMTTLPPTHMTTLPPTHMTTLPPTHMTTLPPTHMTTLPPPHMTTLPPTHMTTLPPPHMTTLPPTHMTTLPPPHMTTLPPTHMTTLPPTHITTPSPTFDINKIYGTWFWDWYNENIFIGRVKFIINSDNNVTYLVNKDIISTGSINKLNNTIELKTDQGQQFIIKFSYDIAIDKLNITFPDEPTRIFNRQQ